MVSSNFDSFILLKMSQASRRLYFLLGSTVLCASAYFLPLVANSLSNDIDSHAPSGPHDRLDRPFHVFHIQVRHLDLGDLLHLRSSHLADFFLVGNSRALLRLGRFHQKDRGGRRLVSDGKGTI